MRTIICRIFVMLIGMVISADTFAQSQTAGKSVVYIDYFYRPTSVPYSWVEALRSKIIEGITETNRVTIIDVDTEKALQVEKARRESGNLSADGDMERLAVMSELGANYIIQGNVSAFTVEHVKPKDGTPYYRGTVAYTLKVVNPKDGTVLSTQTFNHGGSLTELTSGNTRDEAAVDVVKYARKAMRRLIDKAFKLNGTILEISKSKGGEAEMVYISLGSDHGVTEKGLFKVFVLRTVAGRASRSEIGVLKVEAVEGADLTLCEVKKGGKEIKAAMEAGQTIEIESFRKKSFMESVGTVI